MTPFSVPLTSPAARVAQVTRLLRLLLLLAHLAGATLALGAALTDVLAPPAAWRDDWPFAPVFGVALLAVIGVVHTAAFTLLRRRWERAWAVSLVAGAALSAWPLLQLFARAPERGDTLPIVLGGAVAFFSLVLFTRTRP